MELDWPVYFRDRLIVGNLKSNVGVATLWMPKEAVAKELKPNSFSVCGQLYTKRGLNALFRNILANPRIRYILLCGVDRQGSGEALKKFFENGLIKNKETAGNITGRRIEGDEEALLDKEIPFEAFELIRQNVELIDMRLKPLTEVAKIAALLKEKEAFAKPCVYPDTPIPTIGRLPSESSVFKIRRDYIGDAWLDALKIVSKFGYENPGMYGKVKAVQNLSIVIEKEEATAPKITPYLKFNRESLDLYIKGFFDKAKGTESYTYGERIYDWEGVDQEKIMVEKLTRFPFDRGVLATLWKPHKDNFPPPKTKMQTKGQTKGWQVPCMVMILGQCIEHNFHMTAVFRSNDIYGAWPLNAFALRKLQYDIAVKIGKDLGNLTTISHIAEVYEIDFEDMGKIIEQNDSLDKTCMFDPRSYYVVSVEGEDLLVKFFTPDGGSQIKEYRENGKKLKVARDLCALILKDMLISELGAACDLGRQLAKAETAVKLGLVFEQDNLLKFKA